MIREILTAQLREEMYYSLITHGIFFDQEKRCYKRTRGTGELLYIDQRILNESKTKRKNLRGAFNKFPDFFGTSI